MNYQISSNCEKNYLISNITTTDVSICLSACFKNSNCLFTTYFKNECKLYYKLASVYLVPNSQYSFYAKYTEQ